MLFKTQTMNEIQTLPFQEVPPLQTRAEHSRSLEDAEKYRALQYLVEVGQFASFSDVETFHGRVGTAEPSDWRVDPSFENGGSDNVHNRPTLYTSSQDIAQDFADRRIESIVFPRFNEHFRQIVRNYSPEQRKELANRVNDLQRQKWEQKDPSKSQEAPPRAYSHDDDLDFGWLLREEKRRLQDEMPQEEKDALRKSLQGDAAAEVHDITTFDPDAVVVNLDFDIDTLNEESKEKYFAALRALAIPETEGSPVSFDNRFNVGPIIEIVTRLRKPFYSHEDVSQIANEANVSERLVQQILGAFNASRYVQANPGLIVSKTLASEKSAVVDIQEVIGGEQIGVPVNLEYVERWLHLAHIVGARHSVDSGTIGKTISVVALFDLDRVATVDSKRKLRVNINKKLGGMAAVLEEVTEVKPEPDSEIITLLQDAYVKPDRLVDAVRKIEGYNELFDMDTRVWEHYTLAEHTETVLRNFEESYADSVPVPYLPVMRLALLVHDMGKPIAARNSEGQKSYNLVQASDFMDKTKIDEQVKMLVLSMIGDGEDLAFQANVSDRGQHSEIELEAYASSTLGEIFGPDRVTDEMVRGFTEMCKMLQICDGGAYTAMAVTDRGIGKGSYRNYPTFGASFEEPVDLGRRKTLPRGGHGRESSRVFDPKPLEL